MIAVDTNILVYAHREELPLHARARRRLTELAEGDVPWALPVFCMGEFLRVVTHARLFNPPTALERAVEALESLCASPAATLLLPGERYWPLLAAMAPAAGARGNLIYDAQIAALCREHGVDVILSDDRDFARFKGVRVQTL